MRWPRDEKIQVEGLLSPDTKWSPRESIFSDSQVSHHLARIHYGATQESRTLDLLFTGEDFASFWAEALDLLVDSLEEVS